MMNLAVKYILCPQGHFPREFLKSSQGQVRTERSPSPFDSKLCAWDLGSGSSERSFFSGLSGLSRDTDED